MEKQFKFETYGNIYKESDFERIRIALDILKLERTTIDGSCYENELHVLQKKLFEELKEPLSQKEYCSKGCYSNGYDNYFIVDCIPMFEEIYYPYDGGYRSKYRSTKTENAVVLTLEMLLSFVNPNEETKQKIVEKVNEYDERKNIDYQLTVKENRQTFYLQNDITKGFIEIDIKQEFGDWLNGSRHEISINLNGYKLNFKCLLNKLNDEIEKIYLQHNIDFALNNTIIKLENGYVFNNVYYKDIDEIMYSFKE